MKEQFLVSGENLILSECFAMSVPAGFSHSEQLRGIRVQGIQDFVDILESPKVSRALPATHLAIDCYFVILRSQEKSEVLRESLTSAML
jgi:hypothetical protein